MGRWRGGEVGRGAGMRGRGAGPAATLGRKRRSSTSSPRSGEVAEPRPSRREHHRPWRWRRRPAAPSTAGAAAATRQRGAMLCSGCRPTRDTPWPDHRKRSSSSSGSTYAPARRRARPSKEWSGVHATPNPGRKEDGGRQSRARAHGRAIGSDAGPRHLALHELHNAAVLSRVGEVHQRVIASPAGALDVLVLVILASHLLILSRSSRRSGLKHLVVIHG